MYIQAMGVAFDGAGSWNFFNDFAMNFANVVIDNSSSSHADNPRIFF